MMRTGPSALISISAGTSYTSGLRQVEDAAGDEVALDLRGAAHDTLRATVEVRLEPCVVVAVVRRAADIECRVADSLLDLGHQQLVDRTLGSVGDAIEPV